MNDLREQLADEIEVAIDNVHDVDVTHRDYANASADVIIAALPGMVQPLVWEESEYFKQCVSGKYTVQHQHDSNGYVCWVMGINCILISTHQNEESAKAAAQAHHVATIMQAFGVQGESK